MDKLSESQRFQFFDNFWKTRGHDHPDAAKYGMRVWERCMSPAERLHASICEAKEKGIPYQLFEVTVEGQSTVCLLLGKSPFTANDDNPKG